MAHLLGCLVCISLLEIDADLLADEGGLDRVVRNALHDHVLL